MTIAADHLETAKGFLSRSKQYLEDGDLHQASEKGWGAAVHLVKAAASANGWEYENHDQFDTVVVRAGNWYRRPTVIQLSDAAHALHVSFYKHKDFIEADVTRRRLQDVESMFNILEPLLRV